MKIDPKTAKTVIGSRYPAPFDAPCAQRLRRCLGDAAGLTQFGVNLMTLSPGGWSSQRHWHSAEDEFVYVLAGELVLVSDAGEELLKEGDCAGFKCNTPNGHHLQNRSHQAARYLEIGSRCPQEDVVNYSDIDMMAPEGGKGYVHKNGAPYIATKP